MIYSKYMLPVTKKIALLLCVFFLYGCDPVKNIVVENKTTQPVYILLRHQKGNNYLNRFGHDTLIPFGTGKQTRVWTQIFEKGNWKKNEFEKIRSEVTNSLYFEVYDPYKQRIQSPELTIKKGFVNKNTIKVSVHD